MKTKSILETILLPIQSAIKELEISGIFLLGCTILALLLANTIGDSFLHFWHIPLEIYFGEYGLKADLHLLVNDGLMTFFFIVVGGEIKREIVDGALSTRDKAILPIIAAIGGMIFPALFYLLFNYNQPTASGWGIPTATDIAFSLTIISLLGKKVPISLKIFLAALAIADDLGAIVVIAIFYSNSINLYYLAGSMLTVGSLYILNRSGHTQLLTYTILGILTWILFFIGGIHPTIAGVVFAFMVPYKLKNDSFLFIEKLNEVKNYTQSLWEYGHKDKIIRGELIQKLQNASVKMEAPLHNVLIFLHPISNYFIMPLFAFANAGVIISANAAESLLSPVSLGIITGLMLGKSCGIFIASWLAVKFKWAKLPDDISWQLLYGMAWIAGIGFTMSMFVTGLAFSNQAYIDSAKLAILIASGLSGFIGYLYLLGISEKAGKAKFLVV